jgi:S1-C subfamily serine protease
MNSRTRTAYPLRLLAVGLIIASAGYWAGSRWSRHIPESVEAVLKTPASSGPLEPDEEVNVRIYKQAGPAVANIVTKAVEYDYFLNPVPVEGAGSGFLIDDKGHVLTNYHVVQGAQAIEVALGDQSRYRARFIGADSRNDIALLQIDAAGHKLLPLPLGDSRSLDVGQKVLATGVVSALGRTVQTGDTTFIDEAIQTDASINRGNSGGPLLNTRGEVIGINSAIYAPSGTTAGIGFAIPINTARRVVEDLLEHGRVLQASLGVETRALWPGLAQALQLPVEKGLLVQRVTFGAAAEHAGIRGGSRTVLLGLQALRMGGDVLVAINGKPLESQLDLDLALNRLRPGDSVILTLYRDGRKMDVNATLGER